jgi:hypothetical protein
LRIDAAGVGHDAHAARQGVAQHVAHDVDEVGGVTEFGPLAARGRQQRHGQFGQVIEYQVIEVAAIEQLARAEGAVAPEACRTADPDMVPACAHPASFY